tara:strand:+ start:3468 stop:4418 length:951 start_codon:yes stop_codon:yes gene_type:complete
MAGSPHSVGGGTLTFPDKKDFGATADTAGWMKFQSFIISGGYGSQRDAEQDYTSTGPSINLPIPTGPSASYAQGWNQEDVGWASSMLGETMSKDLSTHNKAARAVSDIGTPTTLVARGPDDPRGPAHTEMGQHVHAIDSITSSFNSMKARKADIRSQASQGYGTGALGLLGQALGQPLTQGITGLATAAESMITYTGPMYREFTFNFALKPTSQDESRIINNIIKHFKESAAPEQIANKGFRIYALPYVFEISYWFKGQENNRMNKIGKSALTNMSVTYGGDRFTTFETGDPVEVALSLSFKEIELLDKKRITAGY